MSEIALGFGSMIVGAALVCAGVIFWPQSPEGDHDLSGHDDGPNAIIDALEKENRRS
jgi:hypothetical protein